MSSAVEYLKNHPWLFWSGGALLAMATVVGLTTTSRVQGTAEVIAYAGRFESLVREAESMGLVVDLAKYKPAKGTGPDAAAIMDGAALVWDASSKSPADEDRYFLAVEEAAKCSWSTDWGFDDPFYIKPSLKPRPPLMREVVERRIQENDWAGAMRGLRAMFKYSAAINGDSYGKAVAFRAGVREQAQSFALKLSRQAGGDLAKQREIRRLFADHPFKVDLRRELASLPVHNLHYFEGGDFRGNPRLFKPCRNVIESPDSCALASVDWSTFRRAGKARSIEAWMQQLRDLDDPYQLAANCREVQDSIFNTTRANAFESSIYNAFLPYLPRAEMITRALDKDLMAAYILDKQIKALDPSAPEPSVPTDAWIGKPMRTRVKNRVFSIWTVGLDKRDNLGANYSGNDRGDLLEKDTRLDYPPLERILWHDQTSKGREHAPGMPEAEVVR